MKQFLERFKPEDNWILLARDVPASLDVGEAYRLGLIEDLRGPIGSTYKLCIRLKPKGRLYLKKISNPLL